MQLCSLVPGAVTQLLLGNATFSTGLLAGGGGGGGICHSSACEKVARHSPGLMESLATRHKLLQALLLMSHARSSICIGCDLSAISGSGFLVRSWVITHFVYIVCRAWVVQSVFGWMFWHHKLTHLSQDMSSDLQPCTVGCPGYQPGCKYIMTQFMKMIL